MKAPLAVAVVVATLVVAAPAQATITVTTSGNTTVLTGDGGQNKVMMTDGLVDPANDYAFRFYSENREPVTLATGDCITDGGAGGGFENIYCGSAVNNQAVLNLGGGDDTVNTFGTSSYSVLKSLTVNFGPGNDQNGSGFRGLPTAFLGEDGDDFLAGGDGPSALTDGGAGADRLAGGGQGSGETMRGGPGNDDILGNNGNDSIFGDEGNDVLVGSSGSDTITGGPGSDDVRGDDTYNAFSGNDTLLLVDGERDTANCGFGADTVQADGIDLLPLNDCEGVTRAGEGGGKDQAGTAAGKVTLGKPAKVTSKRRRLAMRVSCPKTATGRCAGSVKFAVSFTERRRKKSMRPKSVRFNLKPGKAATVARKLSKSQYRRLRRAKKRKLTTSATSKDSAGKTFKSSRTSTLSVGR